MTRKSQHPRQPLTTRLIMLRHELARHAGLRRHHNEDGEQKQRPAPFPFFITIALIAIILIATISAFQLLDAALG